MRFFWTGVFKATAKRSGDFEKNFCIQFCDNRSQIVVTTIGVESLNYTETFVIDPPGIIFLIICLKLLNYYGSGRAAS